MGETKGAEMSEQTSTENVLELVEKAQKKGVFDISKFAKGIAFPEDTLVAYLDIEAAYRLSKINSEMNLMASDAEAYEALEKEAKDLSEKILASKITFYMRGVSQEVIESVEKKADTKFPKKLDPLGQVLPNPDWNKYWVCGLIATNIVKIENANGEIDERVFEVEDVLEMHKHFPKEVFDVLTAKMQQLTLASSYFKGLTDAGFLPKS